MAKQELLATVRDRYRASSKREKSRILDEFIAVTGHHRKHGIRLLGQSGDDGAQQPAVKKGRRIYDEAVREALIVVWEAADRICGKRLKAALPHLVESMERPATWVWTIRFGNGCWRPAPPPWTGCSNPSGHRRPAGTDEGGSSRRAAIYRCGPSPIGMRRHRDSWRLTWWSTTAALCGIPWSTAWWPPMSAPAGLKRRRCWPGSSPWWSRAWRPAEGSCPSPSNALTLTTTAYSSTILSPSTAPGGASSSLVPGRTARTARPGLSKRTGPWSATSPVMTATPARWPDKPWPTCMERCDGR